MDAVSKAVRGPVQAATTAPALFLWPMVYILAMSVGVLEASGVSARRASCLHKGNR
jgi:hypothetical protein